MVVLSEQARGAERGVDRRGDCKHLGEFGSRQERRQNRPETPEGGLGKQRAFPTQRRW